MSEQALSEQAEFVRRFFDALERSLRAWGVSQDRSFVDAIKERDLPPETLEMLAYVSPELEWSPIFSSETYRGLFEVARGWDELLEASVDYHLTLHEAFDLDAERVFVTFGPTMEGRSSGIRVEAAVFAIVTIREGLIARIEEYTNRRVALEAAGRSDDPSSDVQDGG